MPRYSFYDQLSLESPVLSSRTRLYRLHPIGLGTGMVESLTGYISRLAAAHAVSAGVLIGKVLRPYHQEQSAAACRYESLLYDSYTLNGISTRAEDWVCFLKELTGCVELHSLTMLAWKEVFSIAGLLRSKAAWCPACYQQWFLQYEQIYEPLLWMLRPVTVCHVHRQTLAEICPHCERRPYVLSAKSCPGHCSLCNGWLGANPERHTGGSLDNALNLATTVAESVATLLASTATAGRPSAREVFRDNLQRCLDDLAHGNKNRLRRAAGLDHSTLESWIAGTSIPSFGKLVGFCYRLEIPIDHFLLKPLWSSHKEWERAQEILEKYESPGSPEAKRRRAEHRHTILMAALDARPTQSPVEIAQKLGYKNVASFRTNHYQLYLQIAKRWNTHLGRRTRLLLPTRDERKDALQRSLKENPPPFLYDVATKLRLRPGTLAKQFPDLCEMIVYRSRSVRRAEVEAVLRVALSENPPPTLGEIRRRTDAEITSWRRWFPDLYKALASRSSERVETRREKQKALLTAALSEYPPLSGKALALKAGVSQSHLKTLFPQLMQAISARYSAHRNRLRTEVRASFRQQVRLIAKDLLRDGQYPSRKKILRRLPDSSYGGGHLVVQEAKAAIDEFPQQ